MCYGSNFVALWMFGSAMLHLGVNWDKASGIYLRQPLYTVVRFWSIISKQNYGFTHMAATSWYWPCKFLKMYAIHLHFTTFITLVFNSMQLDTRQKQKNTPVCPIRKSRLVANENHKSIFLWVSKRWTRPDAAASSIINAYTDFCVKQFCSLFSSMHLRLWCLELTLFLSWNLWVIISSCN